MRTIREKRKGPILEGYVAGSSSPWTLLYTSKIITSDILLIDTSKK